MQDIKAFEPLWGEWWSTELLGQGTFGRVYKMVKRDLDKEYYAAVKHLSLPSEPGEEKNLYSEGLVSDQETLKTYYEDVLKSLRTEIDLCYKLKGNTNIVSYEDHIIRPKATGIGYDIFIKMELLTNLQDRIKDGGLMVSDVVKLGEDICKALVVLRREKIIHRDIKPGNIFINSGGDYKLGDFGVSKSMERTVSSMSVKGTFSYMPPEMVRGGNGDYRVDIYSLGLVLYRLLNKNRGPFLPLPPKGATHELNMRAQERRLSGEDLPPPADADKELSGIVLKACAYLPEDRWRNAEEMGKALAEYRLHMEQAEGTAPMDTEMPDEVTERISPIQLLGEHLTQHVGAVTVEDPLEDEPTYSGNGVPPDSAPTSAESQRSKVPSVPNDTSIASDDDWTEVLPMSEGLASARQDDPNTGELLPTPELLPAARKSPPRKSPSWNKPTSEKNRAKSESDITSPLAASKPEDVKLPKDISINKFKLLIIPAAAVAVILIGIICVSTMANQPVAPSTTSSLTPEPVEDTTEPILETDRPELIVWQDSVVCNGVLNAIGIGKEDLTQEMLGSLEELRLSAPESEFGQPPSISTWADLSLLPGLKTLELSGYMVDTFTFPADMPELETLKLIDCGCTSIAFLERPEFRSLRVLNLSGNKITDLSPISGLSELTRLDISRNSITSLAPLSGLSNLSALWATGIQVEDWSAVEHVAQVEGRPDAEPTQPNETQMPKPTSRPAPAARPTRKPTPPPAQSTPVIIAVNSVSVFPSEVLLSEGGGIQLGVNISPSNATNQRVSWSSSNTGVAVVDGNGYVSVTGRGTARITAMCDGKSGVCTVTVD